MTESLTLSLIKYTPYVKPQSRNSFVTIWGGKCEEGVFILQTFSSEGENANSIFIVINKLMRNVASKCLMSNAEHQVELHLWDLSTFQEEGRGGYPPEGSSRL